MFSSSWALVTLGHACANLRKERRCPKDQAMANSGKLAILLRFFIASFQMSRDIHCLERLSPRSWSLETIRPKEIFSSFIEISFASDQTDLGPNSILKTLKRAKGIFAWWWVFRCQEFGNKRQQTTAWSRENLFVSRFVGLLFMMSGSHWQPPASNHHATSQLAIISFPSRKCG